MIPERQPLSKALDLLLVDNHIVRPEIILRWRLEVEQPPAQAAENPDRKTVELAIDGDPVLGIGHIGAGGILAWHEQRGGDRLYGRPLRGRLRSSVGSDRDANRSVAIWGLGRFNLVPFPPFERPSPAGPPIDHLRENNQGGAQ